MLIAPEESDAVIGRVNGLGRVENFQTQTQRVAQGGSGMSENARTKRDKVELTIAISREEQEQAFQQTSLRIRTSSVDEKAKELRTLAEKQGGRVRSSSFSRDPDRATRNSRAIETVAVSVSAVSSAVGGHRPPLQLTESFLPAPQTSHKLFMFSEG